MLFNSLSFLLFFPAVLILLSLLRADRAKLVLLLLTSYFFYMCWRVDYVVLILGSTLVDFFVAKELAKSTRTARRKVLLACSLVVNLGILVGFKYFNFLAGSVVDLGQILGVEMTLPYLDVLLPVGISFYTFQTLSYTVDVYKRELEPEEDFVKFALYVSFFPQLVAGPIERAGRLLPQFESLKKPEVERIWSGLRQIAWGLFKKMIVADRLAMYVNAVYNEPGLYEGLPLVWATYFFAFQIYCDFSGYSDIAIGSARILGFDLMTNFRVPYFANSVREFWQRWHISLSTWFRDYVYIPLGGNRGRVFRWGRNILITFLISGLWHGAAWTFVIWGGLHGVALLLERYLPKLKENTLSSVFKWFVCFHFVIIGWVFFRANSVGDAIYILRSIPSLDGGFIGVPTFSVSSFIACGVSILFVLIPDAMQRFGINQRIWKSDKSGWLSASYLLIVALAIYLFGIFEAQEFIYFQF